MEDWVAIRLLSLRQILLSVPSLASGLTKQSGRSHCHQQGHLVQALSVWLGQCQYCDTSPAGLARAVLLAGFTQPNCLFCVPAAWHMLIPRVDTLITGTNMLGHFKMAFVSASKSPGPGILRPAWLIGESWDFCDCGRIQSGFGREN